MAYFHEQTRQIILTDEEKETFKECHHHFALPPEKRKIPEMSKYFLSFGMDKNSN